MSREIKVRAWDKECHQMEYAEERSGILDVYFDFRGDCFKLMQAYTGTYPREIDAIMMLNTGLKDKNGKDIYDGDIIDMHIFTQELGANLGVCEGEREYTGSISIDEYGVYFNNFHSDDQLSGYLFGFNLHEESLEVKGNIHEHPEMLK